MKKYALFFVLLVIAIFTFSCSCDSSLKREVYAGLGSPDSQVPFLTKVRKGVLPNGLTYYVLKNSKPENYAMLALVVNAGSVLEKDDQRGLAHFVEHMVFDGTKHFPKNEIINYLRSLGMRFGAEVNAYTNFDNTVYYIEVPIKTDERNVKVVPNKALNILNDWMQYVLFNQKDVDNEKKVILEEKRLTMTNAGTRIWLDRVLPILYRGSIYADRWPIGLPEVVKNVTVWQLKDFYKTWYRPDNMSIVIVGDFDDVVLENSLKSIFNMPKVDMPLNHPKYDLPGPKKGNLYIEILTDNEQTYYGAYFYYKRTPKKLENNLYNVREVFIDMLVNEMTNMRFSDKSRELDCPYINAFARFYGVGESSRFYSFESVAKENGLQDTIKAVLEEKERILQYGWTQEEINRAKTSHIAYFESKVSEKRIESSLYLNNFIGNFLGTRPIVVDDEWIFNAAVKMFPLITAKELNAAFKEYFKDDDLTVFAICPETENLISKGEIEKIIKDVKNSKIVPPLSNNIQGDLVDNIPKPGAILRQVSKKETDTLELDLENGARVILKQTANKDDQIVLYALAKGGIFNCGYPYKDLEQYIVSARLSALMCINSGLGKYSYQEIRKKLSDKNVNFYFGISNFDRYFFCNTSVKDTKTLFEVVYLSFSQPKIESDAVKYVLDQFKTDLLNVDKSPERVLSKEIVKVIYGNNPYFTQIEISDLDKVNESVALDFIKKSLNPKDYTFVFAGNIDIELFKEYIKTYLASIKQVPSYDIVEKEFVRPKPEKKEINMGNADKSSVSLGWYVKYVKEDYSQTLSAQARVFNKYMDIILIEHMRMKLGQIYYIAPVCYTDLYLRELSMGGNFSCAPKKAKSLINIVISDIRDIARGNVDKDVLVKAKKACKTQWEKSVQNNFAVAEAYAYMSVFNKTNFSAWPSFYDAVTSSDLKNIAKKLLSVDYFQVILSPVEAKSKK
ncbi:MAG: insulinase family protein [Endomicrobium sp.]|jgi:zinc protease|nr:insulinase family protein [Endomicrobium sp.]